MRDIYLHELDRATPEERDALAKNIYLALCRAWAWDHGVNADFEIVRREQNERSQTNDRARTQRERGGAGGLRQRDQGA